MARDLGGLEVADELFEQLACLGRVVGAVVADVDVQREPLGFGPGVDRDVRFGEHQGAGEAGALELVEAGVHHREAGGLHLPDAHFLEALAVEQQLRIAATTAQITDEMQTVHV
jgi:hypothetical protein